jgi:hypothetical protein
LRSSDFELARISFSLNFSQGMRAPSAKEQCHGTVAVCDSVGGLFQLVGMRIAVCDAREGSEYQRDAVAGGQGRID